MNATSYMARLAAVLALSLILPGTHALGQVMIDSGSGVQTFTNLGGTSTADPISFDSFNSSLGTLDSVEIVLSNVTLSGSAFGTNTSNVGLPNGDTNGPEDIYLNLVGTLTVTASGGVNSALHAEDTSDNFQTEVAVGASTTTFTYTNIASLPSGISPTTSTTAGYLGNGVTQITVDVTPSHFGVSGQAFASADSNANYISANYNGGATADGDVQVYYTYTAVPEPSHTAALLIGFALCLLGGRKYFRSHGDLQPA
jgi:hypothetical protein